MEYQLTIVERSAWLHARATGANEPKNLLRFLRDAYAACIERDRTALLLETRFSGPSLATSTIFGVVTERSNDGAKLHKIAYVDGNSDYNPEKAKFAETVAVNRGVNVRLFRTVAEAEAWLREP